MTVAQETRRGAAAKHLETARPEDRKYDRRAHPLVAGPRTTPRDEKLLLEPQLIVNRHVLRPEPLSTCLLPPSTPTFSFSFFFLWRLHGDGR